MKCLFIHDSCRASSSEYPSKYKTFLRLFWLILALAFSCTRGFALNAIPKPAAASISKSFAPSPTAITFYENR